MSEWRFLVCQRPNAKYTCNDVLIHTHGNEKQKKKKMHSWVHKHKVVAKLKSCVVVNCCCCCCCCSRERDLRINALFFSPALLSLHALRTHTHTHLASQGRPRAYSIYACLWRRRKMRLQKFNDVTVFVLKKTSSILFIYLVLHYYMCMPCSIAV